MSLIDQMKYAKILYLADVLEDISAHMQRQSWEYHNFSRSINGIVSDLRDTIASTASTDSFVKEEKIHIKRLESHYKADAMVPLDHHSDYEASIRHRVENDILSFIRSEKLVRIRRNEDEYHVPTFTASLIVGIEKDREPIFSGAPITD